MGKQSGIGICMIVIIIIIAVLGYEIYRDFKGATNENITRSMQ